VTDDDLALHAEVAAMFASGAPPEARVAAGRKRKKCKRTALHPHCKSVKWSTCYEAVRRKGKSKKNAAQICNAHYNRWRQGRIKRKRFP